MPSTTAELRSQPTNAAAAGEAIGSRDSRQVASHAQKHFIKLCLAGEPLPAKVAETGRGYTLSGKLLDPNSSAAISYGFRMEVIQGRLCNMQSLAKVHTHRWTSSKCKLT